MEKKKAGKLVCCYISVCLVILLAGINACGPRNMPPLPTQAPLSSLPEAISAIQAQYAEVSRIKPVLTPQPFVPDRVIVFDRSDHWDIIFATGSGDCPSGCLNLYYWYFSAWKDGKVEKIGEYSREFKPAINGYEEKGKTFWGYPH
jgi:hypothetical protein